MMSSVVVSAGTEKETVMQLYQNSESKDHLTQFVQRAMNDFLSNSEQKFSPNDVLQSFFTMQDDVDFASYHEFKKWADQQEKTIVLLYESYDLSSAIFYEYLKQLQQEKSQVQVVKILVQTFLNKVVYAKSVMLDHEVELHEVDVVPNVVMIDQDVVKQLSLQELLTELKLKVQHFIES